MTESKLAVASMDFAVKILKLCNGIKGRYGNTIKLCSNLRKLAI